MSGTHFEISQGGREKNVAKLSHPTPPQKTLGASSFQSLEWSTGPSSNPSFLGGLSRLSFPGLAQYSGDPRIEWHLNAFNTKDEVIEAVRNLPYKGGNTLTGTLSFSPHFWRRVLPKKSFITSFCHCGCLSMHGIFKASQPLKFQMALVSNLHQKSHAETSSLSLYKCNVPGRAWLSWKSTQQSLTLTALVAVLTLFNSFSFLFVPVFSSSHPVNLIKTNSYLNFQGK